MDSNKLKKITDLLEYGDGKFLVVENDEPAFVVMDIDEYKMLKEREKFSSFDSIDRINRDLESWRDFNENENSKDEELDDEGFDPSEFINEALKDYDFDEKKEDEIVIEELEDKKEKKPENDAFKVSDGIEGIPF